MPRPGVSTKELLIQILGKVNGLEERMNQRFEQVDKRFEKIEASIKNMDQFIKKDAALIEEELNYTMMKHFQKEFPSYDIRKYDDQLKTIRHHMTGKLLTDFDGLYLLQPKSLEGVLDHNIFVIVEAKRHTTLDKVNKKLAQQATLAEMVQIAKVGNFSAVTKKFKATAATHKLAKVHGVYLYIGGPIWEPAAFDTIEEIVDVEKRPYIGYIKPSGSRYTIKDGLALLTEGGKNKTLPISKI